MCKKMLMMGVVLGCLAGTFCGGAMITNDFNEVSDFSAITWTFNSPPFTWGDAIRVEDFWRSSPASMMIRAGGYGGGGGWAYVSAYLALGGDYDVWAGGNGAVSVWVNRYSKASNITVELRNDTTVRASAAHSFDDWSAWHEVTIPLDGDETDINTIVFRTSTWHTNTSMSAVLVDDLVIIPEPATILMLVGGGLVTLRRRIRA